MGMPVNPVAPRLVLLTPIVTDLDGVVPALGEAVAAGDVASVILRLAAADERGLVNRIKALAPIAQAGDAALIVAFAADRGAAHDAATLAARGGADGIHVDDAAELKLLRERYRDERIVGAGGLTTRHDAMAAGEAGADYVLFGEPGAGERLPPLDATLERAEWWAEIFETPCIAVAPSLADCAALAGTGVEFVGLAPAAWMGDPARAVAEAGAAIAPRNGRAV